MIVFLSPLFLFAFSVLDACEWSPKRCGCPRVKPSIHHRIVGGDEATPHSWPFIVSIRYNSHHSCGGAVINSRFVVSAAHCFPSYLPSAISHYTFAMGHHTIHETQFVSSARKITLHKSYEIGGKMFNDIAMIELAREINFENDKIGFICLPLTHIAEGYHYPPLKKDVWVIGWGNTRFKGDASPTLLQVSVPITNNAVCIQSVTDPLKQVCAGFDKGGKDSCQGDSGGPLIIELNDGTFELIGIVSFGSGCAQAGRPGIYTRVSGYIDWMKTFTKDLSDATPSESPVAGSLISPLAAISSRLVSSKSFVELFLWTIFVLSLE